MTDRVRATRPPRPADQFWRQVLQLTGLSAFAVAQPLFDVLARNGEFLLAHRARPADIVLLAVLVVLVPAVGCFGLVWAARRVSIGLGRSVAALVVALLLALTALPVLDRLESLGGGVVLLCAASVGALGGWLSWRRAGMRAFLLALWPVAVLFPAWLFFATPVSTLMRDSATRSGSLGSTALETTTPVVVVVFDELSLASLLDPQGAIRHQLFPNFDDLASTSHWYRNATTVGVNTTGAVPAILSGKLPRQSALTTAADHPDNLFALLRDGGYGLRVFEWHTSLCAETDCVDRRPAGTTRSRLAAMIADLAVVYAHVVLPDDFAISLPAVDASWRDFAASEVTVDGESLAKNERNPVAFFERFLDALASGKRSTLYFVHVNLPHVPWKYLPSGREYGPVNMPIVPYPAVGGSEEEELWQATQSYQRHLLQAGFVDGLVGRMRERLEEAGIWDDSLLVVVADHGLGLVPREPRRQPRRDNVDEVLNIPLFVKLPGQSVGSVSERNVETTDLMPSIAEVLGLDLPWRADGSSILGPEPADGAKLVRGEKLDGESFSYSIAELTADRGRTLDFMETLLGDPETWDALLAVGPAAEELQGRPLDEMEQAVPVGAESPSVVLDQPAQWTEVDPTSSYVPAHVSGRLLATGGQSRFPLAIAINETIQATTWSYRSPGGDVRFSAIVPERALAPGFNRIQVLRMESEGSSPRLTPLDREDRPSYRLVVADGKNFLVAADGRRLPVASPASRARARVIPSQLGTSVRGNLRPRDPGELPDELVAVLEGRPLFSAPFSAVRQPPPPGYAGNLVHFEFRLPDSVAQQVPSLSLFLVGDGRAESIAWRRLERDRP